MKESSGKNEMKGREEGTAKVPTDSVPDIYPRYNKHSNIRC